MEPNEQDAPEVHETQETIVEETTEETTSETDELTPEQIADLKKKAEASSQNFERAKKAEEEVKRLKTQGTEAPAFSPKDVLALTEHGVKSDDFDEVVRVAKVLNKPIADALKDPILKSILNDRAEERKTSNATATRGGVRNVVKSTGQDLLRKAETTGEVPDSDEGMRKLAEARIVKK